MCHALNGVAARSTCVNASGMLRSSVPVELKSTLSHTLLCWKYWRSAKKELVAPIWKSSDDPLVTAMGHTLGGDG